MDTTDPVKPIWPPATTQAQQLRNVPVAVRGVEVSGSTRTRDSYFQHEFQDALACKDLQSLHQNVGVVVERLRATGAFKAADVNIQLSDDIKDGKIRAIVNVQVKEKLTPYLKVIKKDFIYENLP